MTTTTAIPGTGNNLGSGVMSTTNASFGDNPFLQLLTEQLKNQTPLEPVDNASFMNQMAQYSSMTEQKQLNDNMLKLLDYQGVLARLQGLSEGSALLGKQVTYDTATQQNLTGTVRSVSVDAQGEVHLRLESGDDITMHQVTGISTAANGPAASGTSGNSTNGTGTGNSPSSAMP
jgi:flagellar basal-body rod modification protein FlgD